MLMKATFVHDVRLMAAEDGVYAAGQFGAFIWERYLGAFDTVTVVGRRLDASRQCTAGLVRSSRPGVSFVFAPNICSAAGFLRDHREAESVIAAELRSSDALIARLPSELGLLATRIARRMGKPWAVEVVGCTWDSLWNHGSLLAKARAPSAFRMMRETVAAATHVLYVSEAFLQGRYPNSIAYTAACSNVELDAPSEDIIQARVDRILNGSGGPVVYGLVGSMRNRYKGIQTVLAALPFVRRLVPGLQFRILGEGDCGPWRREAHRMGVADSIFFDGVVAPGDPVLEWMDGIDIYLQPSLQEGLPRALVEAMSRGCPAIGSRRAGIPELLLGDCLIPAGDSRALSQKMVRAASDRLWRAEQARRNWGVARSYAKTILGPKRHAFWRDFADSVGRRPRKRARAP